MASTLKTTRKIKDITLHDKIRLLVSLWDYDFLSEEQIHDMTVVICGSMVLDGLNPQDQILPFAEYLDGDFDRDYDEDNEDDPHIYCTITSYLNCEHLTYTQYMYNGMSTNKSLKVTKEVLFNMYELWFNYNGYFIS